MAVFQEMPLHDGEMEMRKIMQVPFMDNPTVPMLSPQLANHLKIAPLIAIGTLDPEGRPWTTIWGGEKGLSQPLGGNIIGIKTPVAGKHDPVVEILVGKETSGQIVKEEGTGRMVSGLTIDLSTRKRTKLFGRMVAGMLGMREDEDDESRSQAQIQLVLNIEQSLGNCPKYATRTSVQPALSKPELISSSSRLEQRALDLIEKADLILVSSVCREESMDTNYRAGPAGFVRVAPKNDKGSVIVWPEYSGNRLYQTLGNLHTTPVAGLCIPDFSTGDVLYVTGTTEILVGKDAAALLPRSNLAVKLTVTDARLVAQGLPFRGTFGEPSPYNPTVRYLSSESKHAQPSVSLQQASLIKQTKLTPTISRFRFRLGDSSTTAHPKPGQYVTLDFSRHLDIGYSHMRDDDPRSLNDDFVRTFTVSSSHGTSSASSSLRDDEFEVTIRKVGTVTDFLFRHHGLDDRESLDVGFRGFEGEFEVKQDDGVDIAYIAAGVGITPILPSLGTLDHARLKLLWTVRGEDVGLVKNVLEKDPGLVKSLVLFVTNVKEEGRTDVAELEAKGVSVKLRRMGREDLDKVESARRYYLCTGVPMKKQLMEWLPGKEIIFEDFNF